jgi:hypothetical protein
MPEHEAVAAGSITGNGQASDEQTAARSQSIADPIRQQALEGRSSEMRTGSPNNQQSPAQQHEQMEGKAPLEKELQLIHTERSRDIPASGISLQHLTPDNMSSEDVKPAAQESLKSTLLAIASSSDAPQALREAAQQLVQHVTGQQLLLTPERNGAVFSHLTMFVPLHGPDGNQTASVHIQTRRGRQGQLDAANCRLLFDLSMKTLGPTLVDVNVMDKIVSLTLWNDHPAISALVDSSRSEITASLNQAGYQLLSLRTTPTRTDSGEGEEEKRSMPDPAQFVNTRYKGVDLRA